MSIDLTKNYKLKNRWIYWYHGIKDKNWKIDSYKKVYEIDNIEKYIDIIKNIPDVTCGMFFIFKEGIMPIYEDKNHREKGGYYSFKIMKQNTNNIWRELTASLVGETLIKNKENITGISLSPKIRNCIVKIWVRDYKIDLNFINKDIEGFDKNESRLTKFSIQ